MIHEVIQLGIYIAIFALAAYGIVWGCARFQFPKWVLWICGAVWMIALLLFLANSFGGGDVSGFHLFPHR